MLGIWVPITPTVYFLHLRLSSGSQLGAILPLTPTPEHLLMSGDIFGGHIWEWGELLAPNRWRPGMSLKPTIYRTGAPTDPVQQQVCWQYHLLAL